ncbi:hypothetical protein [Burkholderia gladioli]|uniref:hypothetical protein n=1 Tax=Burkholderia gladioli TaxID=28095 RepID=UPI0016416639|nr:hypothetical protein [Burkholderia gladioli]
MYKEESQACLIFSHGSPDEICGQDGETALVPEDLHSQRYIPVFAYACHSALFGRKAHQQQRVWWGYDKSMVPPPLEVVRKVDVEAIFRYIAHRFDGCSSPAEVRQLIDEIRDQCQKYAGKYWRDRRANVASSVFFMQLWTRLRVWTPWGETPIAHEEAWSGDLDDAI